MSDSERDALYPPMVATCATRAEWYDARIAEAKWEMEHVYKIPNFWTPDADEDEALERDIRKEWESYHD